ncbi:MAG: TIM barrel protein [Planctomycetaceae bacterium]|nr:TIM barrel protein [Planctomycetaceae bacterium]
MESRRQFITKCALGGAAVLQAGLPGVVCGANNLNARKTAGKVQYGLVTYNWGKDWDLPTLIEKCEIADVLGVELRTTHKHAVERTLSAQQRRDVKQKFTDSPVTMVGIGSNERYDNPDPEVVKQAVLATQDFIKLSHDVGGTGVKVKPDSFHKDVPHEVTIEQIGKTLNQLGKYGLDWGQQIRLEVHGKCAELPTIKKILDVADHPNVAICWNCNPQDLQGEGLKHNFNLVKDRMGDTVHIHDLINSPYPHQEFFELLAQANYSGWLMLEEGKVPKEDIVGKLAEQKKLFTKMWK